MKGAIIMLISIKDIQKTILRSTALFQDNTPKRLSKQETVTITNYAYSLGIMYPASFIPGFTRNLSFYGKGPDEILSKVCVDLRNLAIVYRQIDLEDTISLQCNEYLIKVFYATPNEKFPLGYFQFMRQDTKSGLWFQKVGNKQPAIITTGKNITPGSEPTVLTLTLTNFICQCKPIGYFIITE